MTDGGVCGEPKQDNLVGLLKEGKYLSSCLGAVGKMAKKSNKQAAPGSKGGETVMDGILGAMTAPGVTETTEGAIPPRAAPGVVGRKTEDEIWDEFYEAARAAKKAYDEAVEPFRKVRDEALRAIEGADE